MQKETAMKKELKDWFVPWLMTAREYNTGILDKAWAQPDYARLMLNENRLESIVSDVLNVAALPDPVGEVFDMRTQPNGLQIGKKRVPLGVIGAIYESRPNVTIDISALCLKSGNAAILRGGKESANSNQALADAVRIGCESAGLPAASVQLIESTDRALVKEILRTNRLRIEDSWPSIGLRFGKQQYDPIWVDETLFPGGDPGKKHPSKHAAVYFRTQQEPQRTVKKDTNPAVEHLIHYPPTRHSGA